MNTFGKGAYRDVAALRACEARLQELGVAFLSDQEEAFPDALRTIPEPPLHLFFRGPAIWESAAPRVGIIGARAASESGREIAYVLAREGVLATILDRRELGREASWAGAGLIPPHTARIAGHPASELRSWSAVL